MSALPFIQSGLSHPCDCGYDFHEKRMAESYLVAHIEQKHGGRSISSSTRPRQLARRRAAPGVGGRARGRERAHDGASGRAVAADIWPVILVVRGIRQRREAAFLAGERERRNV